MNDKIPPFEEYLHEKEHIWTAMIYLKAIMMCENSFQAWNCISAWRDDITNCFGESVREFIEEENRRSGW